MLSTILEDINTYKGVSRLLAVLLNLSRRVVSWVMKEESGRLFSRLRWMNMPLITSDGSKFFIRPFDFSDAFVLREVVNRKVYEKCSAPGKGDTVIDIGAGIGTFTVRASSLVGEEGSVISIEPNPENYKLLLKNIKANRLQNVISINEACTNYNGTAKLFIPGDTLLSSLVHNRNHPSYVFCKVERLDSLIRRLGIGKVDFLKIDVEGSELEVLEGALETLSSNQLRITLEVHPPNEHRVVRFLGERGFSVKSSNRNIIYASNINTDRPRLA